jgi:hypothetical protein
VPCSASTAGAVLGHPVRFRACRRTLKPVQADTSNNFVIPAKGGMTRTYLKFDKRLSLARRFRERGDGKLKILLDHEIGSSKAGYSRCAIMAAAGTGAPTTLPATSSLNQRKL